MNLALRILLLDLRQASLPFQTYNHGNKFHRLFRESIEFYDFLKQVFKDFVLLCPFTMKKFPLPQEQCCPQQKPPVVIWSTIWYLFIFCLYLYVYIRDWDTKLRMCSTVEQEHYRDKRQKTSAQLRGKTDKNLKIWI